MGRLACPYLKAEVELSDERERHISERHPDLSPAHEACIAATLADPDQIRHSRRFRGARPFSKWYDEVKGGKHIVVVIVSANDDSRHWIITAYITRSLAAGEIEWARS